MNPSPDPNAAREPDAGRETRAGRVPFSAGASVLITGGAGFIGSHLAMRLQGEGAQVRVLDDLSAGQNPPFRRAPSLEFVRGSVLDRRVVDAEVGRADFVFHLAAVVGVDRVLSDSARAAEVNGLGTELVVDACARASVPLLFTSSSEVYGADPQGLCREMGELPQPVRHSLGASMGSDARADYARSKALGEARILRLREDEGLQAVIVRLFNTVGPGQQASGGMVLPRFVRSALRSEPLTVHGDGRQVRCFADVRDVTRAILELAQCDRAFGQIVNVGSERECSIRELAERVVVQSRSASKLVSVSSERPYDPRRRRPDLRRLQGLLGWVPDRPLAQTIQAVLSERRSRPGVTDPESPALSRGA